MKRLQDHRISWETFLKCLGRRWDVLGRSCKSLGRSTPQTVLSRMVLRGAGGLRLALVVETSTHQEAGDLRIKVSTPQAAIGNA